MLSPTLSALETLVLAAWKSLHCTSAVARTGLTAVDTAASACPLGLSSAGTPLSADLPGSREYLAECCTADSASSSARYAAGSVLCRFETPAGPPLRRTFASAGRLEHEEEQLAALFAAPEPLSPVFPDLPAP